MTVNEILEKVFSDRKENKRNLLQFREYCEKLSENPRIYILNIFQAMSKMVQKFTKTYTKKLGIGEYTYYNLEDIFENKHDEPFFADQIFASKFTNTFSNVHKGDNQNKIYIFEGPHGCGKSIFLNNLIESFCSFINDQNLQIHEIVWVFKDENKNDYEIPCPHHDHPLLLISKLKRAEFLKNIIGDEDFLSEIFNNTEFQWIFRDQPCAICESIFQSLIDQHNNFEAVFDHVYTRKRIFDRRIGEGVVVHNINDEIPKKSEVYNEKIQDFLDNYFKSSGKIRYVYSDLAKINDGIYALMDIKQNNKLRYEKLHSLTSEGTQKVENFEEKISSLFIAVSNPHDEDISSDNTLINDKSFEDRKIRNEINYVLDDYTELQIYYNTLGENIKKNFMPEVLRSFSKVIVATRMKNRSKAIETKWINDTEKYYKYCDEGFLLLKMNIYNGIIPNWIEEEDLNKFDNSIRKEIMKEGTLEGDDGISGRYSLQLVQELITKYDKNDYIDINDVYNFFYNYKDVIEYLPSNFLDDVVSYYDYTVLSQIKDCLYDYSYEIIRKKILDYLFIIVYDIVDLNSTKNVFDNQRISLEKESMNEVEKYLFGYKPSEEEKKIFRDDQAKEYAVNTATREMELENKSIEETRQFQHLVDKYQFNLKETALEELKSNDTFRQAIKDYNTEEFSKYDDQIKEQVQKLFERLINNYEYNETTAQKICIYVIDKNLADKF